ncbi:NUDIX domain-containing protein [Candidatus Nitrosocosmicus franklandus]|uniref:Dihydroneopterin triphosphate pyrophosphatase n=1 Tax=Candidatus Nitrosocosmicus franklandianus TaxID=1798806 RepID=A0A484I8A1_9ARCH|nr:NUDIX domain-containing protein [Candidatus Nitrosocosmicus franklandus]VFJ13032.1 Dihydroneopterin triphosphate pyrophosphatase [Candidatus Nitrosocosmicus franklandus]
MTIKNKTIVVTSILGNDNEILILHRNSTTKSMQNKWAGISGYLEPSEDLLSRALVEIYEETRIQKHQIIMDKILDPISVEIIPDMILLIQPFYFFTSSRKVILNWEHTEYHWINSYEIDNYEFVPKFKELLEICFSRF